MTSAKTFRMAAAAALTNANELCAEAKLLAENGHNSRAAGLAVIGLEEFAKAVVFALAGIFPEQSSEMRQRLLNHDVKHWIADTFEGAQIVTDEWPLILFQETGSWPPAEEVLRNIFVELSKREWVSLVPLQAEAEAHRKKMKSENKEFVQTPYLKNAAFYVDIYSDGEVLLPTRVDRFAVSEIQGLAWSLRKSHPLLEILSDEEKWTKFAEGVRQSPGVRLGLNQNRDKVVAATKKQALQLIKSLPEKATWDDILHEISVRKKVEAGLKAADDGRVVSQETVKKRFIKK